MDDIRSESALIHFQSRASQPNTWKNTQRSLGANKEKYNQDQAFADHVDDTRFKYVGVSPQYSREVKSGAKRTIYSTTSSHA